MTEKQIKLTENLVNMRMANVITDSVDRNGFVANVIDDIVEDIDCTDDWSEFAEDEVCIDDINIALARVLINLSEIGK
jgi:hypothetical protein